MHSYFNFRAVTGEMFIDRVIENFENHVMQAALIRVADVHSGTFANGLEAFQFVDLRGIIFLAGGDAGGGVSSGFSECNFVLSLGHKGMSKQSEKRHA